MTDNCFADIADFSKEIWTYRDCGCQVGHKIPCCDTFKIDSKTRISVQTSKGSLPKRLLTSMSTAQLELYLDEIQAQPTMYRRVTSMTNFTTASTNCEGIKSSQRQFMEPVCDDCVVREQGEIMVCHGENLIWGSEVDVKIETKPDHMVSVKSKNRKHSTRLEDISSTGNWSRSLPLSPIDRVKPKPPFRPADDADDEGSRYQPVSVPIQSKREGRTQSRQLRRRGIDLIRDELRISSRWPSAEQRNLEDFRKSIMTKTHAEEISDDKTKVSRRSKQFINEAKIFGQKLTQNIRAGVIRSRSPPKRHAQRENQLAPIQTCFRYASESVDTTPSIVEDAKISASTRPAFDTNQCTTHPEHDLGYTCKRADEEQLSWQHHLHDDLSMAVRNEPRTRKAKYLSQEEDHTATTRITDHQALPSQTVPHRKLTSLSQSQSCTNLPTSRSTSFLSERDRDPAVYWRLPSISSSYSYSRGMLPSSASVPQLERLDETVDSSGPESDESSHSFIASDSSRSEGLGLLENEKSLQDNDAAVTSICTRWDEQPLLQATVHEEEIDDEVCSIIA